VIAGARRAPVWSRARLSQTSSMDVRAMRRHAQRPRSKRAHDVQRILLSLIVHPFVDRRDLPNPVAPLAVLQVQD
jgi:hypothetical protein